MIAWIIICSLLILPPIYAWGRKGILPSIGIALLLVLGAIVAGY
jgi:hypothetical protein